MNTIDHDFIMTWWHIDRGGQGQTDSVETQVCQTTVSPKKHSTLPSTTGAFIIIITSTIVIIIDDLIKTINTDVLAMCLPPQGSERMGCLHSCWPPLSTDGTQVQPWKCWTCIWHYHTGKVSLWRWSPVSTHSSASASLAGLATSLTFSGSAELLYVENTRMLTLPIISNHSWHSCLKIWCSVIATLFGDKPCICICICIAWLLKNMTQRDCNPLWSVHKPWPWYDADQSWAPPSPGIWPK